MDNHPEEVIEFIQDNVLIYGKEYFICPPITKEQQQQFEIEGMNAICCTWMPQVFDDINNEKLKICDNIGIPIIWQGLPEQPQVYVEPLNILSIEFVNLYFETLTDPAVRAKYTKSDLNRILAQMKQYKENNHNISSLKTGILIKLKTTKVPFARKYPIARVRKILKRDFYKNIEVIHVKIKNGKIVPVQNSAGYIDISDIECILSESIDTNVHLAVYTKQQLLKSRERRQKMKQEKQETFNHLLKEYLGAKIKGSLNETNFNKNGQKNRSTEIQQEAMKKDVNDIFIPSLKRMGIEHNVNNNFLNVNIKTVMELSQIIGSKNIMNNKKGFEYFIKYPMNIKFGFQWKFPAFKATFKIGKANRSGNIER